VAAAAVPVVVGARVEEELGAQAVVGVGAVVRAVPMVEQTEEMGGTVAGLETAVVLEVKVAPVGQAAAGAGR